jgi:cysteinyl-tRNA synthetase
VAYANVPLAKYWLHAGMLTIGGQKMAKSAGNFITIKDALAKYDADTIKVAFMNSHWRKPFNWEESAILEAKKTVTRLVRAKERAQGVITGFKTEIDQALEDDFNAPKALAVIMKNIGRLSRDDFKYIEDLFGLELRSEIKLKDAQERLFKERNKVREAGDYKKADEIRKALEKEGIMLEDTPTGTRFYRKS